LSTQILGATPSELNLTKKAQLANETSKMNQPGGFVHEFHATAFSAKSCAFYRCAKFSPQCVLPQLLNSQTKGLIRKL
jgi:hypothetical protein